MKAILIALAAVLLASPAFGKWDRHDQTDSFDGERRVMAVSPVVRGEPYGNSRMVLRCTDHRMLSWYVTFDYLNPSQRNGSLVPIQTRWFHPPSYADLQRSTGSDPDVVGTGHATMARHDTDTLFIGSSDRAWMHGVARSLIYSDSFAIRFGYYG